MRAISASRSDACGAARIEPQQAHTATGAMTTRCGSPCGRKMFTRVFPGQLRSRSLHRATPKRVPGRRPEFLWIIRASRTRANVWLPETFSGYPDDHQRLVIARLMPGAEGIELGDERADHRRRTG